MVTFLNTYFGDSGVRGRDKVVGLAKGKKRKEKEATSVYRFKTKPRHMEAARLCWGHRVSLC